MEIYKGDKGTALVLNIIDQNGTVTLEGATVEATIKTDISHVKTATITDSVNGVCEVILDEIITNYVGPVFIQAKVTTQENKVFHSDVERFLIEDVL